MPYSIVTKDGIKINNIPDDVDPDSDQLRQRVAQLRGQNQDKLALQQKLEGIDTTPRQVDVSQAIESPLEAGLIAAGRGMTGIGRGAQRLFALATGDTEEADRLAQLSQSEEQVFQPLEERFPVSTFVGEVAGETAALPIGGAGTGLAARGLSAAGVGGLAGGVSELGRGGTGGESALAAATGTVFGPVGEAFGVLTNRFGAPAVRAFGNILTSRGINPSDLIKDGIPTETGLQVIDNLGISEDEFQAAFEGVGEVARQGRTPEESFRIARAAEEGVDLTQGQASRDFAEQSAEDTLRGLEGIEGTRARTFFTEQQEQLTRAKDNFVNKLQGEFDDSIERGVGVRSTLREINAAERATISDLYQGLKEIEGGDTRINASLLETMESDLARELSPSDRVLRGVQNIFEDFELRPSDSPSRLAQGPLRFNNAEAMRQRLNKLKPTESADIAYVSELKRGLDDLFAGAVDALPENAPIQEAAQAARSRAAQRFATFENKDIIEDLTSFKRGSTTERVPDELVLNRILASGNRKVTNLKAVKRVLNQNPSRASLQAWREIQTQAALDIFGRAIDPSTGAISGRRLNSSIERFGQPALSVLFDKNQLNALKRVQGVIGDATIPVARTTNPSGSALKFINAMSRVASLPGMTGKVAQILGSGASEIQDRAQRQAILEGIERGATQTQRGNAFLQLASGVGARQSLLEQQERE